MFVMAMMIRVIVIMIMMRVIVIVMMMIALIMIMLTAALATITEGINIKVICVPDNQYSYICSSVSGLYSPIRIVICVPCLY